MIVKITLTEAKHIYKKNFGGLMLMTLIQLLIRLAVLAPLFFLTSKQLKPLAALAPVLYILLIAPLRRNAAKMYRDLAEGRPLQLKGLFSFGRYSEKMSGAAAAGIHLLPWAIPVIAATVYIILAYNGVIMDVFTLLRSVMDLGNLEWVKAMLAGTSSATIRGVIVIMTAYLLTFLILSIGCALNSWRRFARSGEKMKRGSGLMRCRIIGGATMIPFLAVAVVVSRDYLSKLLDAVSGMIGGGLKLPPMDGMVYVVGAAFVLLYLPRIPLSSIITAVCVKESLK